MPEQHLPKLHSLDRKKHLLVSVGTTKFDKLIDLVTSKKFLEYLSTIGFESVTLQTGTGRRPQTSTSCGICIKHKQYFENFGDEVKKASLVISHAGAGTCIEVMRLHVPLIVVINEELMDNHQVELAGALQKEGYLVHCTVDTLLSKLQEDLLLVRYPVANDSAFCNYIDKCMGFSN